LAQAARARGTFWLELGTERAPAEPHPRLLAAEGGGDAMGHAASLGQKNVTKYRESSRQAFPKKYDEEKLAGSNGTFESARQAFPKTHDEEKLAGLSGTFGAGGAVSPASAQVPSRPRAEDPPLVVLKRAGSYRPSKESTASTATPKADGSEQPGSAPCRAPREPSKEQQGTSRDASKEAAAGAAEQPAEGGRESGQSPKGAVQGEALRRAATTGLDQACPRQRETILKARTLSWDDPMGGLTKGMSVVGTGKVGQEMGAGTVIGPGSTPGMVMVRMEVSGREMALSAARLRVVEEGSHVAAQLRMEHSRQVSK